MAELIVAGIISLIGTGISWYLNSQENKKLKSEAQSIDARDYADTQATNRFSQGMQTKIFNMNKQNQAFNQNMESNRFALDKYKTGVGVNQIVLKNISDMVNKNETLKNNVLTRWSI